MGTKVTNNEFEIVSDVLHDDFDPPLEGQCMDSNKEYYNSVSYHDDGYRQEECGMDCKHSVCGSLCLEFVGTSGLVGFSWAKTSSGHYSWYRALGTCYCNY